MTKEPENDFLDPHSLQTPKQNTTSHNHKHLQQNYTIKLTNNMYKKKSMKHKSKEQKATLHRVGCTPTVQKSLPVTNNESSNW